LKNREAWPVLRFTIITFCCLILLCISQVEVNRKRENELTQLRKDFETQAEENEKTVADLRKKHTQAVTELEEKVDSLQKAKSRYMHMEQIMT